MDRVNQRLRKHGYKYSNPGKRQKLGGFTIPGYPHCGPFNRIGNAENSQDQECKDHDQSDEYKSNKAYFIHNQADETLLRKARKRKNTEDDNIAAKIIRGYFGAKKRFTSKSDEPTLRGLPQDYFTPQRSIPQKRKLSPEDARRKRLRHGPSFQNLRHREQVKVAAAPSGNPMPDGGGSGVREEGVKETPVDDPYNVFRGPPDYTFASLPYIVEALVDVQSGCHDLQWRMTSPYDVVVNKSWADQNPGTGVNYLNTFVADTSDTTATKARYFDYYASTYKYYSTLGCRYNVSVENVGTTAFWVYWGFCNEDPPPTRASNNDMQLWKDINYKKCNPQIISLSGNSIEHVRATFNQVTGTSENEPGQAPTFGEPATSVNGTNNEIGGSNVVISGEYNPGDFKREIRLDADVENWTAVTTNPKLPERLWIRVKPASNWNPQTSSSTNANNLKFVIRVRMNYLTEFKELHPSLKWPYTNQPLTCTLNPLVNATQAQQDTAAMEDEGEV